jgi:hypothetical protein
MRFCDRAWKTGGFANIFEEEDDESETIFDKMYNAFEQLSNATHCLVVQSLVDSLQLRGFSTIIL